MSYYSDEPNDEIDDYDEDQSIRQLIGASKFTLWIRIVVGSLGLVGIALLSIYLTYTDFMVSNGGTPITTPTSCLILILAEVFICAIVLWFEKR